MRESISQSRWTLLPDLLRATVIGFGLIAVLAVLGVASAFDESFLDGSFRLNGEWTIPALVSGLVLLAGSLAGLVIVSREAHDRFRWFAFALVLGWMAVDEIIAVHERLEAATGVDWQVLYLPVGAFAVACWTLVRERLETQGRRLFEAGAAAWIASQLLELLQWQGDTKVPHYLMLMVPEELLEMTGSLLFLLALLTWSRRSTSS